MAKKKKKDRFEDMQEMQQVYDFYTKHKTLLVSVTVVIGLLILGYNWFQQAKEDNLIMASKRLFDVQSLFDAGNYERVILDGINAEKEFNGETQGGTILLLVAKSYAADKKYDEGIDFLESRISAYAGNDIVYYGANTILAGFYAEKWNFSQNKEFAVKAAKIYENCIEISNKAYALESAYNAAKMFNSAGENERAKELLADYYDPSASSYGIKGDIKKLYQSL